MEDLVPGFRFFPTEEELLSFYLHNQLEGKRLDQLHHVIPIIDIYQHEPWHLPKLAGELCHGDTEQWFFFTPRQERETRGGRPNRTTASGYWKATGSPGYVYSSDNRVIGVKKAMVFYKGKAPTGRKTMWKMNEYRAIEEEAASTPSNSPIPKLRHEFSLCRVYVISGAFRAFDRRPPGADQTRKIMSTYQQVNGNHHRAATSSQITNQVVEMEETNSLESTSYSGGEDYIDIDFPEDETNLQMIDGLDLYGNGNNWINWIAS